MREKELAGERSCGRRNLRETELAGESERAHSLSSRQKNDYKGIDQPFSVGTAALVFLLTMIRKIFLGQGKKKSHTFLEFYFSHKAER